MAVNLAVGKKVDITLCPKHGNCVSTVNGTPDWLSSDTAVAAIQSTSNGGLAARVIGIGAGSCTITATAVGNSGNIVKTVDITVSATYATSIDVTVSAPF